MRRYKNKILRTVLRNPIKNNNKYTPLQTKTPVVTALNNTFHKYSLTGLFLSRRVEAPHPPPKKTFRNNMKVRGKVAFVILNSKKYGVFDFFVKDLWLNSSPWGPKCGSNRRILGDLLLTFHTRTYWLWIGKTNSGGWRCKNRSR